MLIAIRHERYFSVTEARKFSLEELFSDEFFKSKFGAKGFQLLLCLINVTNLTIKCQHNQQIITEMKTYNNYLMSLVQMTSNDSKILIKAMNVLSHILNKMKHTLKPVNALVKEIRKEKLYINL